MLSGSRSRRLPHGSSLSICHVNKRESRSAQCTQAGNIRTAAGLVRQHGRDFSPLSSCSEAERDRIEAEVGGYLKACAGNVARLEASVPAVNGAVNATAVAHQHGVVRVVLMCWLELITCVLGTGGMYIAYMGGLYGPRFLDHMTRVGPRLRVRASVGSSQCWICSCIDVATSSPCNRYSVVTEPVRAPRQCLILSERLQAVGRAFDNMRSQRALQLARQQQRRPSRTQPVRCAQLTARAFPPYQCLRCCAVRAYAATKTPACSRGTRLALRCLPSCPVCCTRSASQSVS